MNLATFRARVSGAIGVDNTDGSTEQSLVDGWVNEAVVQFLVRTKAHARPAALSLTAEQSDYEMDSDILAMRGAWIEPSGGLQEIPLRETSPEEIIAYRRYQGINGDPSARLFALQGSNVLMLFPPPASSSDILHIFYVPRPTALAASSDSPSATANGGIPEEFHPVLENYVKWKAAEYANNGPSQLGQMWKAEWEAGLVQVRVANAKRGGLNTQRVRVGAPARWPSSPGVDNGA